MKKYVTFSILVFCAIALMIFVANLIYKKGNTTSTSSVLTTSTTTQSVNSNGNNTTLSQAELAKHNSSTSCWLLISGKVYDVTSYINQHPGGANEILKTCGTDATEAYNTKDGEGRPHSSEANQMLQDYYIGNLGQTANQ